MEQNNTYQWFALYTKARAEKKVYEQLRSIGIDAYLPLTKELRQWSDRKKWVEVPVIHSYIFVYITPAEYMKVFDANGIVSYVSHKGKAIAIPDHEMEAMRRTVDNHLSFSVETNIICKGETITIESGPLKGITGTITEIRGEKKFCMQISHIGYTLVVNLDE